MTHLHQCIYLFLDMLLFSATFDRWDHCQ